MKFITQVSPLLLLAVFGSAETTVETNDVTQGCRTNSACQQVVTISDNCDNTTGNDVDYNNCVCNTNDMQSTLNSCALCIYNIERPGDDDRTDNDVTDLMRDCGWTPDLATTTASGSTSTSTGSSSSGSSSSGTSSVSTPTPTTATITSAGSTFVTTQTPSATAGSASQSPTTNGASVPTALPANVLAGAALAAMAFM
ncbi:hypothetical protein BJ166DRAFT_353196 [Pestalotiopsis sp. NC0098]|nr:hypothetical protein BJ166DRAFT_353196 [Pestalotiopsis sp. NC0098]